MRTLFIAEKPSVAKAIAEELGVVSRGSGFITCKNDTTVTWCFGHLLELAMPDAYLPDDLPKTKSGNKIWRIQDLPIFPEKWLANPRADRGVRAQLDTVGRLLKTADEIVNAGDPDREGQLLVDEVLEHFHAKGEIKRFWVSAVDPASLRKGLAALKVNRDYAGMRDAARGRGRADWLIGMNLSRAYTLTNRGRDRNASLIAVGRVQTPTLFMVARRDWAVRNFVPVPYLSIFAELSADDPQEGLCRFRARWRPRDTQPGMDEEGKLLINLDIGRTLVEKLNQEKEATVTAAGTKRKKAWHPKAYSLADIQIEASRAYGMSAQETLNVCQSLYETHKITSYPRTDCGWLPESQHADAPAVLAAVTANFPAAARAVEHADPKIKSRTFDDKKVTAHHGIVPVANTVDPSRLNDAERKLYRLIAKRYIAQFYPVHEYDETEITFDLGGEVFAAKGRVVKVKGWKALYAKPENPAKKAAQAQAPAEAEAPADENDNATGNTDAADEKEDLTQTLPALKKGDIASVEAVRAQEKQTRAPSYYTEGTLIAAMENVWRSFDNPAVQTQLKDAGGIGTPATRAAIITELKRKEYLVAEGKKLHCTETGRALLKKVSPKIRSAVLTAAFEEKLKEVEAGRLTLDAFVAEYEDFIRTELGTILRPQAAAFRPAVPEPEHFTQIPPPDVPAGLRH